MIHLTIIKQVLIEDYEKNNDIYITCESLKSEFQTIKFKITETDNNYEVSILSLINNSLLDTVYIDKK